MKKHLSTRTLAFTAVAAALAFILQMLGSIVGLKVGGFLEIELSDLPPLIVAFAYGPLAGVVTELIKNLLHCGFTSTGFVGELANFIVNGIFVFCAGIIYKNNRTRKGALTGMTAGILAATVAGIVTNFLILLPLYMPAADFNTKLSLVLKLITPFNLCKGIVISLLTYALYKHLSPLLKKK